MYVDRGILAEMAYLARLVLQGLSAVRPDLRKNAQVRGTVPRVGLWHGASWNYIIWGLYFGLFILIETLLGKKRLKKIPKAVKHIYTKLVIIIGFGIFYFTDIKQLGYFFRGILFFSKAGFVGDTFPTYFVNNIFLFLIALVCCFPIVPFIQKKLESHKALQTAAGVAWGAFCIALLIISSIFLVNATEHPFLYTNF